MKKAINIWSFPADLAIRDCMRLAADAGFDGLELALGETGALSLSSSLEEIASYRRAADELGLDIPSLATGLYWSYSMTSEDAAERQRALDIAAFQIRAAHALGVDAILVVPGAVDVAFDPTRPVVPYDAAYERALYALRKLAPLAEDLGVTLGVENVWNKFLLSPLEMRGFLDQVGSARVGAYFDVGNVLSTGYPDQWIRILGHRIARVHVKDFRTAVGTLDGFVDLLSGDVDFQAVLAALRDVGYHGWMTAEVNPSKRQPLSSITLISTAMDAILKEDTVCSK